MGNRSKKGSAFERKFCKRLSLWWTGGKLDDVFWRTSQSGGRATQRMKSGKRTADAYGDIGAERECGKALTKNTFWELKRGYTGKKGKKSTRWISVTDILDTPGNLKKHPILIEWWLDAQKKRKECGRKRAFIVFRRDRKKGSIVMSRKVFLYLSKINGRMMCPPYYAFAWINWKGTELMILRLEDFFDWCKPLALGGKRVIKRRSSARQKSNKPRVIQRRRTAKNTTRSTRTITRRNR